MITESILNFLLLPLGDLLDSLPISTLSLSDGVFSFFRSTSSMLNYILPVNGLFTILVVTLGFRSSTIIMSLIVRVKSFIPGMGD